jgi:hypothetical protein
MKVKLSASQSSEIRIGGLESISTMPVTRNGFASLKVCGKIYSSSGTG